MRQSWNSAILLVTALLPSVAGANMTVLWDETERLRQILSQEQESMTFEEKDLSLEATGEFFPDDGTELPPERQGDATEQGFVTFRIADVPYVLKDVPTGAWFAPYVRDAAERGIVSGYRDAQGNPLGIFGPERNVTLEELAKMAVQAAAIDVTGCPAEAKNAAIRKTWSEPFVSCAEKYDFIVYGDGVTDVRRPATRTEVVVTILQAFGRSIGDEAAVTSFRDVNASTLFAPAIAVAVRDGIVSGYTDEAGNPTGSFGPGNPVNRAEVAKIISRSIQTYAK